MPTFHYSAYGDGGQFAQGSIDAASPQVASEMLWAQGLTPFKLMPEPTSGTPWWRRDVIGGFRSPRAELAAFTRELATLIGSEIPLDDALRMLSDQGGSARMRTVVESLRADVLDGSALSDAMQRQFGVFPSDYVSVVSAGEIGGTLGQVLEELAFLLERRLEIRASIRSALIYPSILAGLSVASLAIIVGVLVPSIAPVFADGGKPPPAAFGLLLAAHAMWAELLAAAIAAAAILGWAIVLALRRPRIALLLDLGKLRAPLLAGFLLDQDAARFTRTLGTLLRAGVPLLQASTAACKVIGNRHIAAGMDRAIGLVREGASLYRALQSETVLPAMALRMIAVGEEAGKLDRMLLTIAETLEKRTQRSIDRFMTVLTPLLTVAIAVLVGGLIMTVMSAILSVNELAVR